MLNTIQLRTKVIEEQIKELDAKKRLKRMSFANDVL